MAVRYLFSFSLWATAADEDTLGVLLHNTHAIADVIIANSRCLSWRNTLHGYFVEFDLRRRRDTALSSMLCVDNSRPSNETAA